MKELSAVLVNLQNPREKVWGILLSIQSSGITLRGIDLNSFEDWSRSVACGEGEMGLSTTFLPIHRVERVSEDETIGSAQSFAEIFEARVGTDVWTHLGQKRGLPTGEAMARGDFLTLAEATLENGEAEEAGTQAYRAMLQAARAIIQTEKPDLTDDPQEIVSEFRARFHDTRKFHDPFAGAKFANYLFQAHADLPLVPLRGNDDPFTRDETRRRIEEAQLFIEAAHPAVVYRWLFLLDRRRGF